MTDGMLNCIKLTTILSFIIFAGVLDAVQPVGSLHQHHQPLQALGVDGVKLHGVLLQGVFVSEALLTQRADHIGTFVRLLLPGIFLLVFFLGICKGEMKSDREINAQFNIFIH